MINRSRAGSPRFDHFWKARARYSESFGPRLAAAIAYYGFFAAFAVGLLGYSVLGFVLGGNPAVLRTVDGYLAHNLPFLSPAAIQNARKTVAIVGLIGLVFAGIGWIDSMRSSQRAMWGLKQQPGNLVVRRLIDLAILIGLGLLLAGALWLSAGIRDLTRLVLEWISPRSPGDRDGGHGVLYWLGQVLTVLVNLLMSAGLLVAVPRLRISPRRIVGPILLVGLGLSVLTTLGRVYITHTEDNPAYAVAGTAVGLLVFLYLFSQLLLFAAALAATSRHGTVTDLARDEDNPAGEAARGEPAGAEPARGEAARGEAARGEAARAEAARAEPAGSDATRTEAGPSGPPSGSVGPGSGGEGAPGGGSPSAGPPSAGPPSGETSSGGTSRGGPSSGDHPGRGPGGGKPRS